MSGLHFCQHQKSLGVITDYPGRTLAGLSFPDRLVGLRYQAGFTMLTGSPHQGQRIKNAA